MPEVTFDSDLFMRRKPTRRRILNDVLIARSAKRAGVTIVTYNVRHFEQIRRYCAVKVVNAADYFR